MAPVLFCSCTNCSCSATVLRTQVWDMVSEEHNTEEVTIQDNRTSNCDEIRTGYFPEYRKEDTYAGISIEKCIFLVIGFLFIFCKYVFWENKILMETFLSCCPRFSFCPQELGRRQAITVTIFKTVWHFSS